LKSGITIWSLAFRTSGVPNEIFLSRFLEQDDSKIWRLAPTKRQAGLSL